MGRYYDDKISLVGLDIANPFYKALLNAADAVDKAEGDWYKRRRDVFDELDFGDFSKSDGQVESKYAALKSGLSVYDFKAEFDKVNPSRKTGSDVYRFVHNTFPKSEISAGYSDERYVETEENDDGDTSFVVSSDVLEYHVNRGKASVDTLYDDLSAFKTSSRSSTNFYEFIDDDDPGYFSVNDVFKGFGQVPLAWNSKSGYSSQQLQVMKAAGDDYDQQVGPVITAYNTVLSNYNGAGGGPLDSEFYNGGTPDFLYQDFVGADNSYNRPQNLPAALINEARGFGS